MAKAVTNKTVTNYAVDGRNIAGKPEVNAAGTAEVRLAPAKFAAGTTNTPIDGPNARTVSNVVVAGDGDLRGPPYSGMMYAFGQFIDHDLGRTPNDGVNHIDIAVPDGDPVFTPGSTIPLTRAVVDPATGTQVNAVTGWLDASMVYGSDATTAASLRTADGHMVTSEGNNLPIVNGMFVAGDVRVAENPDLTALHILMVREHNHWADQLIAAHPDWTGDQVFNQARAIVTGEFQAITYNEYLPQLLGNKTPGQYRGFDPKVDPRTIEEFAGSTFRFGHTIVSGEIGGTNNDGSEFGHRSLADSFFEPASTFVAQGGADGLLRHLASDLSNKFDVHLTEALRSFLVDPPTGQDLAAINIERGRDLGFRSLNETRSAIGLKPYKSFDQITKDPVVAANLSAVYGGDVNEVELWIGGLAENPAKGALVGTTFQAIIAKQFDNLRSGDPLWYENQGFDPALLDQIRNTTLSDLMTRNTDTAVIQPNSFVFTERHASDAAPEAPDSPQLVMGIDAADAVVAGGPADDTIVAGAGIGQQLTGAGGNDRFVFLGGGHTVTITDFGRQNEVIDFEGVAATSAFKDLTITNTASGALVQLGDNSITIAGLKANNLKANNFAFNQQDPGLLPGTSGIGSGSNHGGHGGDSHRDEFRGGGERGGDDGSRHFG